MPQRKSAVAVNDGARDSVIATAISQTAQRNASKKRKLYIAPDGYPVGAMRWSDKSGKAKALHAWRAAIIRGFGDRTRALRVAWTLEWLISDAGYAYCSDTYLARQIDLPRLKVQATLHNLERGGAIIRASVRNDDGTVERRIYPAAAIAKMYPTVGNKMYPTVGTQKTNRIQSKESATQKAARLDAERREARTGLRP